MSDAVLIGPASVPPAGRGQLSADISSAVVRLFLKHTGRGPTKARTTIDADLVVVLMKDTMTTGEKSLVRAGKETDVLHLRRTFQETLRSELVETVEGLTDRSALSFMSSNNVDPDTAAMIFVLDQAI